MDITRFAASPVGRLVPFHGTDGRSGEEYSHVAFSPDPLGTSPDLRGDTWRAVGRANHALGRLSQAARQVPSPWLLRRPTLTREAHSTSALEGTFAPIDAVLASDAEDDGAKLTPAVREIRNYMDAAELAFAHVAEGQSLSVSLLGQWHATLVAGTSSSTADAGRIRTVPVVIGSPGSSIDQARFVPPPPGLDLHAAVTDLLDWIRLGMDRDPVVGAALAHYQFETLHPFNDGNGRIGRLLVVAQLISDGSLSEPLLSISPWFESRKAAYMEALAEVSATGDWDAWVTFFAQGIEASAKDTALRVDRLLDLQNDFRGRVKGAGTRGVILDVVDNLIAHPFLRVGREARRTGKTPQALYPVVDKLVQLGVLSEVAERRYDRMWVAAEVVRIIS